MNQRIIDKVHALLMTEYTEGDPLDGDDVAELNKGLRVLNGVEEWKNTNLKDLK